jgi:UDP:flavonoid glycosyltransferase YjiC (YdhE family)
VAPASAGYVLPYIRLAQILQEAGHQVCILTASEFDALLMLHGIPSISVVGRDREHPFLYSGHWFDDAANQEQIPLIENMIAEFQPDVVVTSAITMSALIAAERCGVPAVAIGFCEYLYPGIDDQDSRKQWRINDLTSHLNRTRKLFGLPGVDPDPATMPMLGQRYLQRSTPEFSESVSYPPQVRFIGSALFWEPVCPNKALERALQKRDRSRPLVYLQLGRLFDGRGKWDRLVATLAAMPVDVFADVGRADYLTGSSASIPENFFISNYVPLGAVAEEAICTITSGQTASFLAAVEHAVPLIVVPFSDDGTDLAQKIDQEGIGMGVLDESAITVQSASAALDQISEPGFRKELLRVRENFRAYAGDEMILGHFEELIAETADK